MGTFKERKLLSCACPLAAAISIRLPNFPESVSLLAGVGVTGGTEATTGVVTRNVSSAGTRGREHQRGNSHTDLSPQSRTPLGSLVLPSLGTVHTRPDRLQNFRSIRGPSLVKRELCVNVTFEKQ